MPQSTPQAPTSACQLSVGPGIWPPEYRRITAHQEIKGHSSNTSLGEGLGLMVC
jgi:hypothetical protein